MEINKRCTNCGYFPFCQRIEKNTSYCDSWRKRERNLKLERINGENFEFEKIGE